MTDNPSLPKPEGELPPPKLSAPRPAAGHSLSNYPLCPNDGFPLVEINGRLECCVETIDRRVGQQTVIDVVQHGQTIYYLFDNGYELPLLCGCCGQGLMVHDLENERKRVRGRRLEAMSIATAVIEKDRREYDELVLEFSKVGVFSQPLAVAVAFEVAAHLRQSATGPARRPGAPSSKKTLARRKKQSGKKRGRTKKR